MRNYLVLLCLLVAAVVVGCGGGGGTSSALPSPNGARAASGTRNATFTLTIPARTSGAASARNPAFVSPNAQSISIAVANGNGAPAPAVTVNLSTTSPACSSITTGGLACTIVVSAPIGSDTFAVTLYAGANGSGSVLSTATVAGTVTAAQSNSIPIVLDGVVASIAVSVTNGNNVIPGGYATSLPVVITTKDASGATIVGGDPYANSITLINADASGVTTLSTSTVTSPATAVTLTYAPSDANTGVLAISGLPAGATQIGASASGVTAANISSGIFQYIADRFAGYGLSRTLNGSGTATITTFNARGTPSPNPSAYAYTISAVDTVHSGATFNGVATSDTNHVITYTQTSPVTGAPPEVTTLDDYRANTLTPTGSIFYQYGENETDANNGGFTSPITDNIAGTVGIAFTYPVAGAWQDDVLPHASTTWTNSFVPFTEVFSQAETATFQLNADDSTSFSESAPGTIALTQTASGTGTNVQNGVTTTIGLPVAATPPGTGDVIPVVQQSPSPAPASTFSAADWYPGAASPVQPLYAWNYTEALVAIPGSCNVPSTIATQAWEIVNQQAAVRIPNFQYRVRTQTDYYVPGGVGWICQTYTETESNYRFGTGIISSQTQVTYTFGVTSQGNLSLFRKH